ncbi:MAG: peptidylprolyl isomerase, partial [Woeseiaceae bacterium]
GGDEDAAETEANEILARVLAGESFEELAAELSDDGGSASRGGSLGTVTSEQLDPDLASEIFSMSEGEVSGPVKSDFGFHVVRLDAILERGALPLDQVRAELLGELRERKSDELFRELERSLSDALFDSDDLDVIAEQVGLEVKSIDAFSREGGGDIGANQVVIDAIFDDAVLTGGQVTDIIEVDANRSALFRVTNYQEATRQPLADVRDEVTQALRTQQAEILMSNRAEQVMAVIDAGGDFGQAAEEAGFTMTSAQILSRSDQNVDQMLMFDVFAAGKPRDDKPVYGRVRSLDGSYKVYTLDAVLPGRPESIPLAERDEGKLMLAQQSGFGDLQAFVLALYENADIVINEDLLAATDMFQ